MTTLEKTEAKAADKGDAKAGERTEPKRAAVSVSLPVSTLIAGALAAVLLVTAGVLGFLLWQSSDDLAGERAALADDRHAEQIATDYAVGAATINYKDLDTWFGKLKTNTVPALSSQFDATAPTLQELLVPLQWTSTAGPIAAKVSEVTGSVYTVNVFVNVTGTNSQNPQGTQSTIAYTVTLDKNQDWKITNVGGPIGALSLK